MKYLLITLLFVVLPLFGHAQISFYYTGAVQTYTVPALVFTLTVDMAGASGGRSIGTTVGPHDPGLGGRVEGTLAVTPGDVINLYVGQEGLGGVAGGSAAGGWNGGAASGGAFGLYGGGSGGGSSDIRIGGTSLTNRKMVAGAGGGSGYNYPSGGDHGGDGGGLIGENGFSGGGLLDPPGEGGTQVAGGTGGLWVGYLAGTGGVLGDGGAGGTNGAGGGGGGGYYGGGGGSWAGGAGGSSYTDPVDVTGQIHTQGYQTGDGYITITPISVLPIEVSEFTCMLENKMVELNWTTLSERNNAFFDIEHSVNGKNSWQLIASNIEGAGNSSTKIDYAEFDTSPINGINYYRLKQVDYDGNEQFFGPVSVFVSNGNSLIIYPLPATNLVTIENANGINSISDIHVFSMDGKEISALINIQQITLDKYEFNISSLSAGSYIIKTPFETIQFVKGYN